MLVPDKPREKHLTKLIGLKELLLLMLIEASFNIYLYGGSLSPMYVIFLFLCFVFVALVVVVVIFLLSYQAVLWAHSHLITYVY